MLKVYLGAFHPHLETAILDRIIDLKKGDPLRSMAVVVPSTHILERLQKKAAEKAGGFLNIHFHTFASLAEEIVIHAKPLNKTLLNDPLFYDTLVKIILREDRPFHAIEDLAVPEGFPPAVRSTLTDLLEAGVDGNRVVEAVKEGFLGQEVDIGSLRQLIRLYQTYQRRVDQLPVFPRSALVKMAIEEAPKSTYVNRFHSILYYGFYDLTGLQSDFFQSVVKHHDAELFFPYVPDQNEYAFAGRFRDSFIQPVAGEEIVLAPEPSKPANDVHVISVSGARDEAWFLSQEIIKCHEENGVPFSDIAVVVRSKERISSAMLSDFRKNNIPYRTSAAEDLSRCPLIDLVGDFFIRLTKRTHPLAKSDIMQCPDFRPDSVDSLMEISGQWKREDSWSNHARMTERILDHSFSPVSDESRAVLNLMREGLQSMAVFEWLRPFVSRDEFLETMTDRWRRMEKPIRPDNGPAVSVLHAEAARGLSFKTVFVVGMEERVFPRIIREDPFLRDDARLALYNTLGYKIPQKMAALEEERLLFHLLTTSATDRLYFIFQRSDDEGSIVGPSPFLREFLEVRGQRLEEVARVIPRPYLMKIKGAPPSVLSPYEVAAGFLDAGDRTSALRYWKGIGMDPRRFAFQLDVLEHLEKRSDPGAHDGLLSSSKSKRLFGRWRMSPSALEDYGTCPFKFFAERLLEMEPLEEDVSPEKWEPVQRGELVHQFLERFYKKLFEGPSNRAPAAVTEFPESLFQAEFDQTIGCLTGAVTRLHPVLWEAIKFNLKAALKEFVTRDLSDLAAQGLTPRYFEQRLAGHLEAPLDSFEWQGQVDRIDVGPGKARIVDYKTWRFPLSGKVSTQAIRGRHLQPPLYILLSSQFLKSQGLPIDDFSFVFKRLADVDASKELSADEWRANRDSILESMKSMIDLMKKGVFSIHPDGDYAETYCRWCDVSSVCRRNHTPTSIRARQGDGRTLRALREKKPVRANLSHE